MSQQATDNHDMAYFGAPLTKTLVTRNLGRGVVSFTRLQAERALGHVDGSAVEDAIMVAYQHKTIQCHVFLEDRYIPVPGQSEDRVTMYDYRHRWSCEIKTAYDATNFYIPRAILNAVSNESGTSGDLRLKPGQIVDDDVVRGFVTALEGTFENLQRPNTLFLDHMGWAFAAHCAATYLETGIVDTPAGGLAPWQERLSKDMIDAHLEGDVRLAELAAACDLSVSHFARAFRKSTSLPPHRWLIRRRIERAQQLLLTTKRPVSEIAHDSGFHDQSHFTNTFTRQVGASPAAWRRARST
jgi:AraC-like DNA-binding protein